MCKDETTPLDGTSNHRSMNGVVGNNLGVQKKEKNKHNKHAATYVA